MKIPVLLALLITLALPGVVAAQKAPAARSRAVARPTRPPAYRDPAQYGQPFTAVPDAPDAVIYQINMRGFSPEGTFRAILPRLDSIRALGVNVVYLMPIFPIGQLRAVDSPFAVRDYTSVNPEFGDLNDLRQLVDAIHARRMAVLLDWVGNHTSWDHAWITEHPDWYVRDAQGQMRNPIPEWKDIVQLDFQNPQLRTAMTQALRYWVFQANIDGFRFDYADGPTYEFFTEAIGSLKSIKSHKLLMLAEGSKEKHFFKAGFQLDYDFPFIQVMRHDILEHGRSVQVLDSLNAVEYRDAPPEARMVRYTSNHDLNAWDGTPQEMFGGERGAMAAFVVAAYMKAVPMVYNGQEVGYAQRVPFMGARRPIVWTPNPALTAEYKRLLGLRNRSRALRRGQLSSFSSADVCAFTKTLGAEKVLTLVNLRDRPVAYALPAGLSRAGWVEAFAGTAAADLPATLTLQPFQYLVLRHESGR
ncbi:alpha-amylase family glycosyl hydrolase [Hymenobacter aerophilus]|uniref:alpha-amylase family glycosyl hydrolase n=1 Tax=Hymenobacter aerophilus TaxID=119644 RepID=UPI00036CD7D9|nr:alpha-amylase family glycosyl hydrolase [Hymenobacter aerophilus]